MSRTVNIALVPAGAHRLEFYPDLASLGDDTLLLEKRYTVTTAVNGTGSIALPTKVSGTIHWTVRLPKSGGGYTEASFYLGPGAAINLEDAIAAGTEPTSTITDYIDSVLASPEFTGEVFADSLKLVDQDYAHFQGIPSYLTLGNVPASPIANSGSIYAADISPTFEGNGSATGLFTRVTAARTAGVAEANGGGLVGFTSVVQNPGDLNTSRMLCGISASAYQRSQSGSSVAYGGYFEAFTGGNSGLTNPTPFYGVVGIALGGHNGTSPLCVGVLGKVSNLGGGGLGVLTEAIALKAVIDASPSLTNIGIAKGIAIEDWLPDSGGTWLEAYGIYIDESIDVGATDEQWAIRSKSTSPSKLDGPFDAVEITKAGQPVSSVLDQNRLGVVTDWPGAEFVSVRVIGLAAGNNDIYTVPAGKKAIAFPGVIQTNNTGGTILHSKALKSGGVYYRLDTASNITTSSSLQANFSFVYEAGESLALNESALGINVYGDMLLLPDTANIKTLRLLDIPLVDTVFYEVPAGKKAIFLPQFQATGVLTPTGSSARLINNTGGAITVTANLVPSGEVIAASTVFTTVSVAGSGQNVLNALLFLRAGDKVYLKATATGILAWLSVMEVDA